MYRERLVGCLDCGDRFKIIYDSKKEQQDKYTCKCGKLVCYPDSYGSFSYDRNGNPEKIPYDEQEQKKENYDEDYIKLTSEEQLILNEIDEIGKLLKNDKWYSIYSNTSDDSYITLELCGCNKSNEGLSISFDVKLQSDDGWRDYEIVKVHNRLIEGLNRFKDIILKVKNNEIDLDNPRKIWNDNSLEWNDAAKTQHKIYDYELYC